MGFRNGRMRPWRNGSIAALILAGAFALAAPAAQAGPLKCGTSRAHHCPITETVRIAPKAHAASTTGSGHGCYWGIGGITQYGSTAWQVGALVGCGGSWQYVAGTIWSQVQSAGGQWYDTGQYACISYSGTGSGLCNGANGGTGPWGVILTNRNAVHGHVYRATFWPSAPWGYTDEAYDYSPGPSYTSPGWRMP